MTIDLLTGHLAHCRACRLLLEHAHTTSDSRLLVEWGHMIADHLRNARELEEWRRHVLRTMGAKDTATDVRSAREESSDGAESGHDHHPATEPNCSPGTAHGAPVALHCGARARSRGGDASAPPPAPAQKVVILVS